MNKILVDGDKIVFDSNIKSITTSGNVIIFINNEINDINVEIELEDNSIVDIYDFNTNSRSSNFKVIQNNNTKFNYYHTFKIDGTYQMNYDAIIKGNKNINNINISGVSHGVVNMNVDSHITPKTKENEVNENIKILTTEGKAYISPMLHVSALDVIANHNTAISNVREDELFYLMSKGIDKRNATLLIEDGYVYGLLKKNDEFYKMIKE